MKTTRNITSLVLIIMIAFSANHVCAQENTNVSITIEKNIDGEKTISTEHYQLDNNEDMNALIEKLGLNQQGNSFNKGESIQIKANNCSFDTSNCKLHHRSNKRVCCEHPENHEKKTFLGIRPYSQTNNSGITIKEVIRESAAEKMGLMIGDIIIEMNNEKTTQFNEIVNLIEKCEPSQEVHFKIIRNGEIQKIKGKIGYKEICNANSHLDFSGFSDWAHQLEIELANDFEHFEENMEFFAEKIASAMNEINEKTTLVVKGSSIADLTEKDIKQFNNFSANKHDSSKPLELDFLKLNVTENTLNISLKSEQNSDLGVVLYNKEGKVIFNVYETKNLGYFNYEITLDNSDIYFLQIAQNEKQICKKLLVKE